MTLLEVTDVRSGYGGTLIIRDVSMSVMPNEMVAIIGPNGAGKSTLLKTIVRLLPCRYGLIEFDGQDITGLPTHHVIDRGLCYMPQKSNVFPNLTVEENLKMGTWSANSESITPHLDTVFELFPILEDRFGQRVGQMSGGQQQMVGLATALMADPKLLVIDEPSAGLASDLAADMFEKIKEINASGTAVLMVEQNAKDALELADRGVVLVNGSVRLADTSKSILENDEISRLYISGSA